MNNDALNNRFHAVSLNAAHQDLVHDHDSGLAHDLDTLIKTAPDRRRVLSWLSAGGAVALHGYLHRLSNLAAVSLASDNVFGDDSAAKQIPTVTGSVASGYAATLVVGI